jgi:hypothetical protein
MMSVAHRLRDLRYQRLTVAQEQMQHRTGSLDLIL